MPKERRSRRRPQPIIRWVLMNIFPRNNPQQRHPSHIQQHSGRLI
uniref:R5 protein n=1 Tax=Bovine leukemia virus TaxID=11901 RepID=A0A2K9VPT6_BLV|nr:R5 protein [Bovine leukemia virus]